MYTWPVQMRGHAIEGGPRASHMRSHAPSEAALMSAVSPLWREALTSARASSTARTTAAYDGRQRPMLQVCSSHLRALHRPEERRHAAVVRRVDGRTVLEQQLGNERVPAARSCRHC
jgi:hypothetical protein